MLRSRAGSCPEDRCFRMIGSKSVIQKLAAPARRRPIPGPGMLDRLSRLGRQQSSKFKVH